MRPILATYRVQLHAGFRLEHLRTLIPYFATLGVSHLHLSPLLAARAGSQHGYDVTDPARINPAIGTEDEFRAVAAALHGAGLGILLDIVPNHMAASVENPAWEDVLTHGSASRFAKWFDIEWRAGEPSDRPRIVLPVLGDLRARALERGEIALRLAAGRVRVAYFEHEWPVDPLSLHPVLERMADECERRGVDAALAASLRSHGRMLRALSRRRGRTQATREDVARRAEAAADRLAELLCGSADVQGAARAALDAFGAGSDGGRRLRRLLDAQAYRIVFWRRAARELNYRRFFDVNELVALHMEDPEVFDRTHAKLLEWQGLGLVDGFRVDHPDGLLDPLAYLRRLADEAFEWRADARYPIYVEKILMPGESLPAGWPVAGTTGYDFLNEVERLFVDPDGRSAVERDYLRLIRRPASFAMAAEEGKRQSLESGLSPGVRLLAARLLRLASSPQTHLTAPDARRALIDLMVSLPVYRTYVDRHNPAGGPEDRGILEAALAAARSRSRASAAALDQLAAALLGGPSGDPEREQLRLRFVQRLQQLSGPVMAKGVEDTAFYSWVPLASLNEVGGSPDGPTADAADHFHARASARMRSWPSSMLAVTTHDTKRSADVRARLDVLSEMADEWEARVYRWRRLTRPLQRRTGEGTAPDVNTLYLFFQMLVGIWPVAEPMVPACLGALAQRLNAYMLKAVREAKRRTSWHEPDATYESAVADYVTAALDPAQSGEFLLDVSSFADRIATGGWWNAISRTVVQLASPGVPDIYQGDEIWNLTLVDPDNRRDVDYARRRALLDELVRGYGSAHTREALLATLTARPADGRLKLHVMHRLLLARRERPALFMDAGYQALTVSGGRAGSVLAFARQAADAAMVVIVPRLVARALGDSGAAPVGTDFWGDTAVTMPDEHGESPLRCLLSGHSVDSKGGRLLVGAALNRLPAAVLVSGPP